MKIGKQEIKISTGEAVELFPGESIQLLVPASLGRACVYLHIGNGGKLIISGGSTVIESIEGPGMSKKVIK